MVKKSKYIINYISNDGYYYLFHTEHGNVIRIRKDKSEKLNTLLAYPNTTEYNEARRILEEFDFLVKDNVNEFQQTYGKKLIQHYCKSNYLELVIMPTEQCNFRCVYCYEDFKKPIMNEFVQDAIIRYVQKEIKNKKGLVVSWFGGEPLLAMDAIDRLSKGFIEICKQNKKPYMSSITTNAFLLDLNTFHHLQELNVNHFQITIDGSQITHDKQRVLANGKPTFYKILDNICNIRDQAKGHLWNISIRTNVTKEIVADLENYKKMLLLQFADDKRFNIMLRKMWTNSTKKADELLCDDSDFEEFIVNCELSENSLYQEYSFSHNLNFICYASKPNSIIFGSDGSIYKCTVALYDDSNKIGEILKDGSVFLDEKKMAYWIAPRIDKLQECIDCANFATCTACCCPYKQKLPCSAKVFDSMKPYIPQFSKLAEKSWDLTECL